MTESKAYTGFAPGRTTLNDHVDYWNGIGIGAALHKGITVKYAPSADQDSSLIIETKGKGVAIRKMGDEALPKGDSQDWSNYVNGAFNYLNKFGKAKYGHAENLTVMPGRITISSDIPEGGGVSSSAALIVATLKAALAPQFKEGELEGKKGTDLIKMPKVGTLVSNILENVGDELDKNHHTKDKRTYFSDLSAFFMRLDAKTALNYAVALLAHRVETEYVGASCGRLDHMSCALAEPGQMLKIDFDNLSFEKLPALPKDYDIMVIDSGQKHDVADKNGPYFQRFSAPRDEIMPFLGISSIKEVTDYTHDHAKVQAQFGKEKAAWFEHAYKESRRGEEMADAIKAGDMKSLAKLMRESHLSLSVTYENSTPLIDNIVTTAEAHGASAGRIVGGGAGGSIALLAETKNIPGIAKGLHEYRTEKRIDISRKRSKGISFIQMPDGVLESLNIPSSGRNIWA